MVTVCWVSFFSAMKIECWNWFFCYTILLLFPNSAGEIINETINQNFNLLSTELIPLIEKALQRIFKRTGNKILERFPEEVLFP